MNDMLSVKNQNIVIARLRCKFYTSRRQGQSRESLLEMYFSKNYDQVTTNFGYHDLSINIKF